MATFSNIFKRSFLEGYANVELTTSQILIVMLFSLCIGLYIFLAYRFLTKKTFYSRSFNISLVLMSVITAAIILAVQSSVVISLGMVGALSIVRFRTAVKDAMDLAFLFWAISAGIICGAGLAEVAIILSLAATAVIFVLDRLPVIKAPVILVVNGTKDAGKRITEEVRKNAAFFEEKSRVISGENLEMVFELRTKDRNSLSETLSDLPGVSSVSVLSHEGEVGF